MAKETKDLAVLFAKVINSIVQAAADGKFSPLQDVQYFIDDLLAIQPAIEGAQLFGEEAATMTDEQKKEVRGVIEGELSALAPSDRTDLADFLIGNYGVARFFYRRGYNKGMADAKAAHAAGPKPVA